MTVYHSVLSLTDVAILAELLNEVAPYWDIFLGQIGVPHNMRDQIKSDNRGHQQFSKCCLLEGLNHWVQSDEMATYGRITAALRGSILSNEVLAKTVEQFAKTHASSTGKPSTCSCKTVYLLSLALR